MAKYGIDADTHPIPMMGQPSQNHVFLNNIITNPNIIVGDFTYYHDFVDPLNFEKYNAAYFHPKLDIKLVIGKFCSIAHGARFLSSSANHATDGFSTYPFSVLWDPKDTGYEYTFPNKGNTQIGNDVWIGSEATIMPGVNIGNGAVVGANAIVTKDVAPYSIVAGNPAKLIRKRFDNEIIESLIEIKWWDWPIDLIVENAHLIVGNDIEMLQKVQKR